jgi:HlyD family secretion protein
MLNVKLSYLFVLALLVVISSSCNNGQETIKPEYSEITESVYSSATVQPDSMYAVYSAVVGILEDNLVKEGEKVKIGQGLAKIVNSTPQLNVENAKLALELARSNYEGGSAILIELENEINSARIKLQNDSINYFRFKRLLGQNIGSKADYENAKLKYEISYNQWKALKNRYKRTEKDLKTRLSQAEINFENSKVLDKDFTVKSEINGMVYELLKKPGESVMGAEPIAHVGSDSMFIIELLIDEVDIARIFEGQKVLVVLNAYGDSVFEAEVSKISPKMDERSQTFEAEAMFITRPKVLYAGLWGEANIVILTKDNTLTIPLDYLMGDDEVMTEEGTVHVQTGLRNYDRVEILSGIDTTDVLIKPE